MNAYFTIFERNSINDATVPNVPKRRNGRIDEVEMDLRNLRGTVPCTGPKLIQVSLDLSK